MEGIDEMWMHCEPHRPDKVPVLGDGVLLYVGGHEANRAPQIAIPSMRPSRALLIRSLCITGAVHASLSDTTYLT